MVSWQRTVAYLDDMIDVNQITGITFSPDGMYAYITDTGLSNGLFGTNPTSPASM